MMPHDAVRVAIKSLYTFLEAIISRPDRPLPIPTIDGRWPPHGPEVLRRHPTLGRFQIIRAIEFWKSIGDEHIVDSVAQRTLAMDLAEVGHRLRRCPAPQRHREVRCGTIFLATAKQLYCSASCASRVATRALRQRKRAPRRRR
jgi:hypothetical protein